jgi:hypothetical protein
VKSSRHIETLEGRRLLSSTLQPARLTTQSDLGFSHSDNITASLHPVVSGQVSASMSVEVLVNGQPVGITTSDESGAWTLPLSLGEGAFVVRYREASGEDRGALSPESTIVIDRTSPTMTGGAFFFQNAPNLVRMTFSESIGPSITPTSIRAMNLTTSADMHASMLSVFFSTIGNVLEVAPIGLSGLPIFSDGNWRVWINDPNVTDVAGNPIAGEAFVDFFVLTGDINRDRRVDQTDFGIMSSYFGGLAPGPTFGDLNYDSFVDLDDVFLLMQSFGQTLPMPRGLLPWASRETPFRSAASTVRGERSITSMLKSIDGGMIESRPSPVAAIPSGFATQSLRVTVLPPVIRSTAQRHGSIPARA